ncbi:PXMP2/4 family protein 4 [Drosophila tropicalis]|uniref:PXMP2/4 family protein 4 n=1 Tax=Drosophila tropicalis TaxID=46794 RepID=UPI0035AB7B1E
MMHTVSTTLRFVARSPRMETHGRAFSTLNKKPITLLCSFRQAPLLSTRPPSLPPKSNLNPNPNYRPSLWSHMFGKYLIVTNIVGSGILLVIGDMVTQQLEYLAQNYPFDYHRSGRMFITGLIMGPIQHLFYNLLDHILPQNTQIATLKKIFWDQLLMSPMYLFGFFYLTSLLEGHSFQDSNDEIKEKFLYTWMMDCIIWPAVQYFNFRYLKSVYRVAFINITNCLYIVLLSYIKHDMGEHTCKKGKK